MLVHAAAGGVGLLLIQLAVARGRARGRHRAARPQKEDLARGAGAAEVIRYDLLDDLATELPARVRELTGGARRATSSSTASGRATFDALARVAAPARRARAVRRASSGPVPPLDPQRLNAAGSLFLTRPTLAHYTATREELLWRAGELLDAVAAGTLDVRVGATFALARRRGRAPRARGACDDREGRARPVTTPAPEDSLTPRAAHPDDVPALAALNDAAVPAVNALGAAGLAAHLPACDVALVVDDPATGAPLAFLLALAPGAAYASENYRWFSTHRPGSLYVDRIVVAPHGHGRGVGRALYDAVDATAARAGLAEVDVRGQPGPAQPRVARVPPAARVRPGRRAGDVRRHGPRGAARARVGAA